VSAKTKIEWTDATWNPVLGCTKVSPCCTHCYAVAVVHKLASNPNPKIQDANVGLTAYHANGKLDWTGVVRLIPGRLEIPLRKQAPTRYFVNSLSDLFHERLALEDVDRVFAVMALCAAYDRGHVFQVLTKRPDRMARYVGDPSTPNRVRACARAFVLERGPFGRTNQRYPVVGWPLPNVWLGTSVENQAAADERIPQLVQAPAAVRFLSCEPLLGPVDLVQAVNKLDWLSPASLRPGGIDWVIVGGESGPSARPMHPDWALALRDQCRSAGVAYLFKQWGNWLPYQMPDCRPAGTERDRLPESDGGNYRQVDGEWLVNVGKKAAGRRLAGRTWDEFPAVAEREPVHA
jgi:protein gp37